MDAGDRANRFIKQWKVNIYPDPQCWELQSEGDFYPDRESLDVAVMSICNGAFRITIYGNYERHPDDKDPTHTPSGRAAATLDWECAKWGGNWAIISIDTEQ